MIWRLLVFEVIYCNEAAHQTIAPLIGGGKSGQHRVRQSLTATGGDSRESATETKLPVKGKR